MRNTRWWASAARRKNVQRTTVVVQYCNYYCSAVNMMGMCSTALGPYPEALTMHYWTEVRNSNRSSCVVGFGGWLSFRKRDMTIVDATTPKQSLDVMRYIYEVTTYITEPIYIYPCARCRQQVAPDTCTTNRGHSEKQRRTCCLCCGTYHKK